MKPLDPQIRRLLDEVTSADLPPAHLEDRLWQQLAPKLGGSLPPTAAAASSAVATKSGAFSAASPLLKLGLGALIAGASVTAVMHQRSVAPTLEASPAVGATHAPGRDREVERATNPSPAAVSGKVQGAEASTQPHPPAARPDATGSAAAAHAGGSVDAASEGASTLVAETQLLARAQRALRNGKPAAALPLIEQHATAYPNGALAQERDAARVLSLCALKRNDQARRAQQQFLKTWPGSPLTERIQRACPTRSSKP